MLNKTLARASLAFAAGLLAWTVEPVPSHAMVINEFSGCDGFGRPSANGDGMTKEASSLGGWFVAQPGYGDTSRDRIRLSSDGIARCDEALTSRLLLSQYTLRRISLTRAKAFHQVAAGDTQGALATLDQADALISADADLYVRRSLKLGIDLLRAYINRRSDLGNGSPGELERLVQVRPYSKGVLIAAMTVVGDQGLEAERREIRRGLARLQPTLLDLIYLENLQAGDYAEAVQLFPGLVPRVDEDHGYVWDKAQAREQAQKNAQVAIYWSERHGQQAFALASLGQYEESRAALAAGRTRLGVAMSPRPGHGDEPVTDKGRIRFEMNGRAFVLGSEVLDYWTLMVDRQQQISSGRASEALMSIKAKPMRNDFAAYALSEALRRALPGDPGLASLPGSFPPVRSAAPTLQQMFDLLPDAETQRQRPGYETRLGLIRDVNGYSISERDGITTVRFLGIMETPAQMIEEAALLRAAEQAIALGKPGFIILGRSDVQTFAVDGYGQPVMDRRPMGTETKLDVVFVDPANPPAIYRATPWRIFDAASVVAALKETYYPAS